MTSEESQKYLDATKKTIEDDLKTFKKDIREMENQMADLRVKLYAKFGDNINLEDNPS